MGALDLTSFDWALKILYDDKKIMSAVCTENPAYARMPKVTEFKGKKFSFAIKYGAPTSRSATFATAQTNVDTAKGLECLITRRHDYAVGRIDTETMLASESDPDQLRDATESEADGAMQALSNSLGHAVFGNGSGQISTVNQADLDTTTLTLGNAADSVHFEKGQKLVFAANDTSALRDTGKTLTVVSVNEDTGTCVLSAKLNTVSDLANGDAIFCEGDYVSAGDRLKVCGYSAWNPATAPSTTETFIAADRSISPTRLAGHRYSYSTHPGLTTQEAIQLVTSRIKRSGFSADTCYMGTDRFRRFINELDAKVTYAKDVVTLRNADGEIVAEVGFDAVVLHCGGAVVKCFPDRNCPETKIYVLKNDTWEFKSMGTCPRWVVKSTPVSNADQIEFRLAYWGQILCRMPAANGHYTFAS